MNSIDKIQSEWAKVGYRFACKECEGVVDIESLIVQTISAAKSEPSLMWALLTWLIAYSDLVNLHRLFRLVQRSHEPVLGAIAETALENGADRRLKYIVNKCTPSDRPGVLFDIMKETHVTKELETNNCLPIFKKWGVYTSSVSIKQDALRSRSYVLSRNLNLAFRAVFGANARAEILFALSHITRAYISQLAKRIGLSYQPVHAEVEHLILNGLVEFEYIGKAKLVSLSPKAAEFVRLLPVG